MFSTVLSNFPSTLLGVGSFWGEKTTSLLPRDHHNFRDTTSSRPLRLTTVRSRIRTSHESSPLWAEESLSPCPRGWEMIISNVLPSGLLSCPSAPLVLRAAGLPIKAATSSISFTNAGKPFEPSQSCKVGVWTPLNRKGTFTLSILSGMSLLCSSAYVASSLTYLDCTERSDQITITHLASSNAFSIMSSKCSPARSFGFHHTSQLSHSRASASFLAIG